MSDEFDASLSDDATFAGRGKRAEAEVSLSDEQTLGGGDAAGLETVITDSEVVDLAARYTIEGTLGQGGMGAVLLATDTRLGRKVAIKRILGEAARSQTATQRFLTEAKAIAALNHPNIVQIYDYGQAKDGPFLIMEYVDGGSLADRCKQGAIPLEEAVDLACQLCDGLAKAHDAGIIHRDIKPANVLLSKDGLPKLTDFGLAKAEASDHGMTMTGSVMGTPDFMPPEQRRDASLVDHRSDLWSLAASVYQMVTGRSPKIIRFNDVPVALQDVLAKALEEEKDARYQSAREFRDGLKQTVQIAAAVVPPAAEEAVEGRCPACGTINTDLTRKFCRNASCGASLRTDCLKCELSLPVWETICGECGGHQANLLAELRQAFEEKQTLAEQRLSEFAFREAEKIARELSEITLPQLADLAEWGRAFSSRVSEEKERQAKLAAEKLQEAKAHQKAFDYPAAIHSLETIPQALRTREVSRLLSSCQEAHTEATLALETIAERIRRKEIDGLLHVVERATHLRGDRADLVKIRDQLTERRDARLARARAAMKAGDSQAAAQVVSRVAKEDLQDEQKFADQVEGAAQAEQLLIQAVRSAKADGAMSAKKATKIRQLGMACLAHHPGNRIAQRFVQQAGDVIQQHETVLARARSAMETGDALAAAQALSREAKEDLQDEQELADRVERAVKAEQQLARAVKSAKADGAVSLEAAHEIQWAGTNCLLVHPSNNVARRVVQHAAGIIQRHLKRWRAGNVRAEEIRSLQPLRNSIGMELRLLPAGRFKMNPSRQVQLSEPFYLSIFAVTNDQWYRVMGAGSNNAMPATHVSWDAASEFCQRLTTRVEEKAAGRVYRLPTEAEWEYACLAGMTTAICESLLGDFAWFDANSGRRTHPVGQKLPNAWGLYDMLGNVWEWCNDRYGHYDASAICDPRGPWAGETRVLRGGSCRNSALECGPSHRRGRTTSFSDSNVGFRVALLPSGTSLPEAGNSGPEVPMRRGSVVCRENAGGRDGDERRV